MAGLTGWAEPAFIAEVHAWLREQADRLGLGPIRQVTQPHLQPWSTVFRATTPQGAYFLKVCGPSQAFEPRLTARLARDGEALVPKPLAVHPTEPWMLLADGGAKLREAYSGPELLEAWARILPRYAELQRRFLGHDDDLLATGLPDRRLDRLAAQLEPMLDDDLFAGVTSVMSGAERETLRRLLPTVAARCRDLAALGIGATAQHDDLHDGNVLVGRSELVFDWGDACLTHPFLTLRVTLGFIAHRANVAIDDPAIVRLRDGYLEPWSDLAPVVALREAAELGRILGAATRALCWYRVVRLVGGDPADPDAWVRRLAADLPR